jgi:phage terminase large subunit GpA-like protein
MAKIINPYARPSKIYQPNFFNSFSSSVAPDKEYSLSEWAEAERVLPSGPWRNDKNPQLKEIMDCLSFSSPFKYVVFLASRQVGKTEAGLNFMGQVIDQRPGNFMVVQSTVETAENFGDLRVVPMFTETPCLRSKTPQANKSRDGSSSKRRKEFQGGHLLINGANSAAGLRSTPVPYLWCDEVSSYPFDVDNEGDPLKIVLETTNSFPFAKVFLSSTPKNKGTCRISDWYDKSDARVLLVPCPHCHTYQELKFENFKFKYDGAFGISEEPYFLCTECDQPIYEAQKQWMLDSHEWEATKPQKEKEKIAGFFMNAFYAPVGFASWYSIADDWLETRRKNDVSLLKSFINNKLAEVWDPAKNEDKTSPEELFQRREDYKAVPSNAGYILCAVDVQKDRLEYEVKAFAENDESYGLEYGKLEGDPSKNFVWQDLSDLLNRTFTHSSGIQLPIMATAIDTGGHHTQEVYGFVARHKHKNVYAFKGHNQYYAPIVPNNPTEIKSHKIKLYTIGVSLAKEQIFYRMTINEPGAGCFHFNYNYPLDYFEQVLAETLVEDYVRGKVVKRWEKRSQKARNEAFDLNVYLYTLLCIRKPDLAAFAERASKGKPVIGPMNGKPIRRRRVISSGLQ